MRRTPFLAATAALAVVLAGCSSTGGDAATDAGQPVSGGSLTWGVETEPITFNPHQYAQAKARLLVWNSFEGLLTHDGTASSYRGWPPATTPPRTA